MDYTITKCDIICHIDEYCKSNVIKYAVDAVLFLWSQNIPLLHTRRVNCSSRNKSRQILYLFHKERVNHSF